MTVGRRGAVRRRVALVGVVVLALVAAPVAMAVGPDAARPSTGPQAGHASGDPAIPDTRAVGIDAGWRIDPTGLDAESAAAATDLLEQAFATLPRSWRDARRAIGFSVVDDLPADAHGRAHAGQVRLSRTLVERWALRDRSRGLDDPGARAALATVVHEVAHVRDRADGSVLSRDPRFRDLAGWQRQPLRPWRRANAFTDRSPDAYETASPAEFLAVNVEHFLLDPAYACRRPALHAHLATALDHVPPATGCARGLPFVGGGGDGEDDAVAALAVLDPARVHQVDVLLADRDGAGAGSFGHVMLRLVVCAPGRPRGPACRGDIEHHRVLSFRAFVDDVQLSHWRGLVGGYPSRLFVLPFGQVLDEYTKVQLRGLSSLPLALGDDEIAALLSRAATVHWSYDGRYAFVGNNCAVETWKLLHDALPRLAALPLRSVTPFGLQRRLASAGLVDAGLLDDTSAALAAGYRFPSADAQFDALFAVASGGRALPADDARDWIDLPPAARAPHLRDADLRASAAMLVLEHAALRRDELRARDALKRRLARAGEAGEDARDALARWLADGDALSRPASLLAGVPGYGLPQENERVLVAEAAAVAGQRMGGIDAGLRLQGRALLPRDLQARIDGGDANLALLGERLRLLQAPPG